METTCKLNEGKHITANSKDLEKSVISNIWDPSSVTATTACMKTIAE
jgi:hypothetical protein